LPGALAMTPLIAVAGMCIKDHSPRRAMRGLFVSSFAGFLLLIATLPRTPGPHLERYAFSLQVSFVMGIACFALTSERVWRPHNGAAVALVLMALCLEYAHLRDSAHDTYLAIFESLKPMVENHERSRALDGTNDQYTALQTAIPPGASLATMLDEPFRLDFARNHVLILDIPGEVSPKPGIPFSAGEEALAHYLAGQSVRYLACYKGAQSKHLYLRSVWQRHADTQAEMPQNHEAPFVLDVMDSVAKLVAKRKHVFEDDSIVAIDLGE
jgi:hypothetical protein